MSRRFEPDDTDRAILRLIQRDASLSLADIAKEVGLTPTPCWKRIRKMEQEGVITGRVVLLDPEKVGLGVSVFVAIETGDHSAGWIEAFATTVGKMPEIVECWRLGGDVDYLLRVVVPDMQAFENRWGAAPPDHPARGQRAPGPRKIGAMPARPGRQTQHARPCRDEEPSGRWG
jgi:Lrp/AsnC family transcriptional regulator